ncbi:MAG: hypothetical protein IPG32_10790 [Saprospirales bacterium]|nr:hypothetical protein [Saprospirales bacterium]
MAKYLQLIQATLLISIANPIRKGTTGLFKSNFLKSPEFRELREGNTDILQKLDLQAYADYIALGTLKSTFREGKLVDGTFVCTVTLNMDIISTSSQSIIQSFRISNVNGNGATEDQAQENAPNKLWNIYFSDHTSL